MLQLCVFRNTISSDFKGLVQQEEQYLLRAEDMLDFGKVLSTLKCLNCYNTIIMNHINNFVYTLYFSGDAGVNFTAYFVFLATSNIE